ncbi:hypothetical protein Y032_0065g3651 [Ancylostoma ceylanicum]|uniref:Uncharacterized protein n=1 Tax=Ancylostoma ceylanicum TaxID=53326 RepID=A0A016U002_9BILA|nr:hypothetical protein Y032_0065g3651 [Ancylostoma ceylanicum]
MQKRSNSLRLLKQPQTTSGGSSGAENAAETASRSAKTPHQRNERSSNCRSLFKLQSTMGVDSGGSSAVSKSTLCDRAAHDGIVAAMANRGFSDSSLSYLVVATVCSTNLATWQASKMR